MENSEKPLKETQKNSAPKKPRAKKTYPKKAESGPGIAGSPEKYKEAHASVEDNKYAPKEKIGKPTLGRSDNYVTRVGLGGLKVTTNGNTQY